MGLRLCSYDPIHMLTDLEANMALQKKKNSLSCGLSAYTKLKAATVNFILPSTRKGQIIGKAQHYTSRLLSHMPTKSLPEEQTSLEQILRVNWGRTRKGAFLLPNTSSGNNFHRLEQGIGFHPTF